MNMRKKFTISLVVSLLFLFGISDSVFGQVGVLASQYLQNGGEKQDVSIRRGDAVSGTSGYIEYDINTGTPTNPVYEQVNEDNVNNVFGAGESATITAGSLSWPGTARLLNTSPDEIQIGNYSQNIVINTYNAGGYASEFLRFTALVPGWSKVRRAEGADVNRVSPWFLAAQVQLPSCSVSTVSKCKLQS